MQNAHLTICVTLNMLPSQVPLRDFQPQLKLVNPQVLVVWLRVFQGHES